MYIMEVNVMVVMEQQLFGPYDATHVRRSFCRHANGKYVAYVSYAPSSLKQTVG